MMPFLPEVTASWLLEAATRAVFLAAIVGAGLHLLRASNPHTQLTAWRGVLAAALAMPVLMSVMIWEILPGPVMAPPTLTMGDTAIASKDLGFGVAGALLYCGRAICDAADVLFEGAAVGTKAATFDWHQVLLPLYCAVAGVLLTRLAVGLVLTLRLRAKAVPLRTDWTAGRDVRVSETLPAPVTVGATILLPADYASWSFEKRAAVIAHESAHAARGDYHVQLLAGVHRALFWFSPLAWWLHDKLADLAELASDAEAATVREQRSSYAAILLDFAARPRLPGIAAVGMARRETVDRRIDRILGAALLPVRLPRRATWSITAAVALLAAASAASLAQGPVVQTPLPPVSNMTPPAPTLLVPQAPEATPVPEVQIDEQLDKEARASARALRAEERKAELVRRATERAQKFIAENGEEIRKRATERAMARLAERNAERAEELKDRAQAKAQKSADRFRALGLPDNPLLQPAAIPQGPRQTETRTVADFTGVALAAVLGKVDITIGDTPSVVLEGSPEALRQVRTAVRHGTLVIDHEGNFSFGNEWRGLGAVTAHVTVRRLRSVSLSGVGRVQVAGLNGGETEFQMSGSGMIEASGKLDKLALEISGAGKAELTNLVARDAEVSISGAGDATVQPVESLTVDISGSARVHYVGKPQHINTSISGWGTVHAR